MTLTEYLFHRVREAGVTHTFGIPGDFVLPVYAVQDQVGLDTVVCAHEPGVGFAADAYARLRGLGVALVTYGAGALNMLNPIACAYAEQIPLLVVCGGPEMRYRRPDIYLHHVVKSHDSQLRMMQEVTVDGAILGDPTRAAETIDRVLANVLRHRRPGYLEIPRDLVQAPLDPPNRPLRDWDDPHAPELNQAALDEAVDEILTMIERAERPALYVGIGVRRYGLTASIVRLAEAWGLPVTSSVLGKASFPESHPQFVGVYMGALGDQNARELLDGSDCVVGLGVIRFDTNTGFWTDRIAPESFVSIEPEATRVRHHRFDAVPIERVVETLLQRADRVTPRPLASAPTMPSPTESPRDPSARLQTRDVLLQLQGLDQSKYSFVADVGDSWFIGLELRADVFLAPGYYASMGFGVPGGLGAGIADRSRRPFILVGDGAFQMTGTELATLVENGLQPIVLLLNNSSYGMLEALDGHRPYYDRRSWDYPGFAESLGCPSVRAETVAQLGQAIARAEADGGPILIEAVVSKEDLSPFLSRIRQHILSVKKAAADQARAVETTSGWLSP